MARERGAARVRDVACKRARGHPHSRGLLDGAHGCERVDLPRDRGPWVPAFFPTVHVFQASRDEPHFGGYAASTLEALGPGSCWANPDEPALECGLTPTGGEPFVITGTDGQDHFTELGCHAGYQPPGTPCLRVFKVSLGAGDDYVRMWNFSDTLADERDPLTGQRPWVASAHAPMHGVEMDMGSDATR